MSVMKKVDALNAPGKSIDEKLYMVLSAMDFTRNGYRVSELGEGISVIEQVIWGWRMIVPDDLHAVPSLHQSSLMQSLMRHRNAVPNYDNQKRIFRSR